jgi:nicotinamidase-related amidase
MRSSLAALAFIAFALPLPALAQSAASSAETARAAALTDLTPENAVLVYVDFNTGLDNLLTTIPGEQFRHNVTAFSKIGQVFDMPIAIFGEENDFYGPFYPEIAPVQAKGRQFHRTSPSGYTPEFAAWLESTGRRNVIIGGISIDNCTLHTSLDLLRNGYNVFVLTDVSPTNNPAAYEAALTRLVQAGAVPMTWVSVGTDLVGDWNTPAGQGLMPVMQAHLAGSTVGETNDTTPDGKGF